MLLQAYTAIAQRLEAEVEGLSMVAHQQGQLAVQKHSEVLLPCALIDVVSWQPQPLGQGVLQGEARIEVELCIEALLAADGPESPGETAEVAHIAELMDGCVAALHGWTSEEQNGVGALQLLEIVRDTEWIDVIVYRLSFKTVLYSDAADRKRTLREVSVLPVPSAEIAPPTSP